MENKTSPARLSRLVGPFQDDGLLSPDYTCRDYDLLERRFKMTGWDSSQQGIYDAGWEAAIRYYWDNFQRPTRGNTRKVDSKNRVSLSGFLSASEYMASIDENGVITLRPNDQDHRADQETRHGK